MGRGPVVSYPEWQFKPGIHVTVEAWDTYLDRTHYRIVISLGVFKSVLVMYEMSIGCKLRHYWEGDCSLVQATLEYWKCHLEEVLMETRL